jgi:hypothetical protein
LALALWLNGEGDAALTILKSLPNEQTRIAMIHAAAGRFAEAADTLLSAPSGTFPQGPLKEAVRLLHLAPAVAEPDKRIPLGEAGLEFVYAFVGAPERVLDVPERLAKAGRMVSGRNDPFWHPSYAPVRKTERFKALMRQGGYVDYWRAKGWPDLCHPTSGDDFECN